MTGAAGRSTWCAASRARSSICRTSTAAGSMPSSAQAAAVQSSRVVMVRLRSPPRWPARRAGPQPGHPEYHSPATAASRPLAPAKPGQRWAERRQQAAQRVAVVGRERRPKRARAPAAGQPLRPAFGVGQDHPRGGAADGLRRQQGSQMRASEERQVGGEQRQPGRADLGQAAPQACDRAAAGWLLAHPRQPARPPGRQLRQRAVTTPGRGGPTTISRPAAGSCGRLGDRYQQRRAADIEARACPRRPSGQRCRPPG